MEIPVPIICVALSVMVGIQGWILKELIDLKMKIVSIESEQARLRNYKLPLAVLILAFLPLLFALQAQDTAALEVTNQAVTMPGPVTPAASQPEAQLAPTASSGFDLGEAVALGTTLATIFFGAKARRWGKIARTVIKGVELARDSRGVKAQIAAQAEWENVGKELHREVKKLTRKK
jgi:hypothetical protein